MRFGSIMPITSEQNQNKANVCGSENENKASCVSDIENKANCVENVCEDENVLNNRCNGFSEFEYFSAVLVLMAIIRMDS